MRLLLLLTALVTLLTPIGLNAQDDPNDVPLGDVARTMRKKAPPSKGVIDDDNLPQVMEQAEQHHAPGSALRFLMNGASNNFRISAPDVTCSLAFTANVKSLLSKQYAEMVLPAGDMYKLEGPATIEGGALILALFNKTDWHVSELEVALTVLKKTEDREALQSINDGPYVMSSARLLPTATVSSESQEKEERGEKRPDETVIYRMRAASPPSATAVFSVPLNRPIGAHEEWHWAIVQAKGYPPQSYSEAASMTTAQSTVPAAAEPMPPGPTSAAVGSENAPASPLPQSPQ
jgi:hypothetical protein